MSSQALKGAAERIAELHAAEAVKAAGTAPVKFAGRTRS